jgi:hypothetical protein
MAVSIPRRDSDASKGATEKPQGPSANHPTRPDCHGNLSYQIPHRESDLAIRDFIDGSDSDFPEPGSNAEHSGEKYLAD